MFALMCAWTPVIMTLLWYDTVIHQPTEAETNGRIIVHDISKYVHKKEHLGIDFTEVIFPKGPMGLLPDT